MEEIELESSRTPLPPVDDTRPKMFEPPPVRLVAIEDCRLSAPAGMERDLDAFYVRLIGFERDLDEPGIVYRAENFRLRFDLFERIPSRVEMRRVGIAVPSLNDIIARLLEAEIEYARERGLTPGMDRLLLTDPAGNLIEVTEFQLAI
jgi:GNAT superfamily N-acetyltransferase